MRRDTEVKNTSPNLLTAVLQTGHHFALKPGDSGLFPRQIADRWVRRGAAEYVEPKAKKSKKKEVMEFDSEYSY